VYDISTNEEGGVVTHRFSLLTESDPVSLAFKPGSYGPYSNLNAPWTGSAVEPVKVEVTLADRNGVLVDPAWNDAEMQYQAERLSLTAEGTVVLNGVDVPVSIPGGIVYDDVEYKITGSVDIPFSGDWELHVDDTRGVHHDGDSLVQDIRGSPAAITIAPGPADHGILVRPPPPPLQSPPSLN
jgi:hypothetical protein